MWRSGFPLQEAQDVFEETRQLREGTTSLSVQGGDSGGVFMLVGIQGRCVWCVWCVAFRCVWLD